MLIIQITGMGIKMWKLLALLYERKKQDVAEAMLVR